MGKEAAPRRGRRERCHILPPHPLPHHPMAVPRVWLTWPSSRDLVEGQPETRVLTNKPLKRPSGPCCPVRLKGGSHFLLEVSSLERRFETESPP